MRDFDKVREEQSLTLTQQQLYALVGGGLMVLGLTFGVGFSLGKKEVPPPAVVEDPLLSPDVQNETVAQLLARAAEEGQDQSGNLSLQFNQLLPNRTGEQGEAPLPGEVEPVRAEPKKEGVPETSSDTTTAAKADGSPKSDGSSASGSSNKVESTTKSDGGTKTEAVAKSETSAKPSSPSKTESSASKGDPKSDKKPEKAEEKVAGPLAKPSAPTPAPAKVADKKSSEPSEARKGSGAYAVQVSSYPESAIADRLVRQLTAQGFSAYRVEAEVSGQKWYRVRIGRYDNAAAAERELQRLKAARSELKPMIAQE